MLYSWIPLSKYRSTAAVACTCNFPLHLTWTIKQNESLFSCLFILQCSVVHLFPVLHFIFWCSEIQYFVSITDRIILEHVEKMWFPSHISPSGKEICTWTHACVNTSSSGALEIQMTVTSTGFCICISEVVKEAELTESHCIHAFRKPGEPLLPKILPDSTAG